MIDRTLISDIDYGEAGAKLDAALAKAAKGAIVIPDINTYEGGIPSGYDLSIWGDEGPSDSYVLYGFDEVGTYESWVEGKPVYGFIPKLGS